MLQHPEQLAQLRANPELLPGAIDEFLRYESPVQLVLRVAREALEFHG
jgi:cytochrome P450